MDAISCVVEQRGGALSPPMPLLVPFMVSQDTEKRGNRQEEEDDSCRLTLNVIKEIISKPYPELTVQDGHRC
jgi:hypothetical protein